MAGSTCKGTARFIRSDFGAGSTRKGTTRFIRSDIGAGSTRKGTTRFIGDACILAVIDSFFSFHMAGLVF